MKLAAIGSNCVDYYQNMNGGTAFPGGGPVNMAVYTVRLGGKSSYIGPVGNDEFGHVMYDAIESKGVDVSHLQFKEGKTAVTQVELIDGERIFGDYDEGVLSDYHLSEDDISFICKHDIVICDLWGKVEGYFEELHRKGILTAFDCATRPDDEACKVAIPHSDYVFFSNDESSIDQLKDRMKEIYNRGPKLVIAMRGEKGSLCFDGIDYHEMGTRCRFVREQRHVCGDNYMEIDLYPISEREKGASLSAKRRQASSRIQQNLNARNARRYFIQLLNANFTESDIHWTGTYDDAHLPDSIEQADHDLELFLRRVRSQSRKRGLPAPRFIAVTEWREEGDGLPAVRVHHHVVLSCGLSRDELERLWYRGKDKDRLGITNADRLQFDRESLERLANYLTKYTNRKRRWRQSRGLEKPQRPRPNDGKYTRRQLERLVTSGAVFDSEFWRRKYQGWEINDITPIQNDVTKEWSIYLKLRRTVPRRKSAVFAKPRKS